METYFQSTLAVNGLPYSFARAPFPVAPPSKKVQPCPITNKDFECKEIHTRDGAYQLAKEISLEIAPQFTVGTRAVLTSTSDHQLDPLSVPFVKESSSTSSLSDTFAHSHMTGQSLTGSSEDEGAEPLAFGSSRRFSGIPPLPACLPVQSRSCSAPKVIGMVQPSVSSDNDLLELAQNTKTTVSLPLSAKNGIRSKSSSSLLSTPPMHELGTSSNEGQSPSLTHRNSERSGDGTIASHASSSVTSLTSFFGKASQRHGHTRKPKNNLIKTKSSFVLKVIIPNGLSKMLATVSREDTYLFFNVGTSFVWMDARKQAKLPLTRIVFSKAYPTCHDINRHTVASDHVDIIIGFSTGDCIWYDPPSCRYFRLNKDGVLNNTSVTMIKWLPGSEDLFLVSFADGTMCILDKDREDQHFENPSCEDEFWVIRPHKNTKHNPVSCWKVSDKSITDFAFSPDGTQVAIVGMDRTLRLVNIQQERLTDVFASFFGHLLCVAWSSDGRYILTGGQDDLVTIWSASEKKIVARCQGHKSWVTGVAFDAWKCDGRVYRFGSVSEDCSLILWDFYFDTLHRPRHSRSKGLSPSSKSPRSPKSPKSPKSTQHNRQEDLDESSILQSMSARPDFLVPRHPHDTTDIKPITSSAFSRFRKCLSRSAMESGESTENSSRLLFETINTIEPFQPAIHKAPSKDGVPYLQPTNIHTIHADPCVDISFREDCIVTTDRRGRIRSWSRPKHG